MQTIETQFRQYHVTKVGGGLEPLGPIGFHAYAYTSTSIQRLPMPTLVGNFRQLRLVRRYAC